MGRPRALADPLRVSLGVGADDEGRAPAPLANNLFIHNQRQEMPSGSKNLLIKVVAEGGRRANGRGSRASSARSPMRTARLSVPLKTLKRADPAAILRLKQESRALTDVCHPNLVTLDEMNADGSSWFFAMELVEGVPGPAKTYGS